MISPSVALPLAMESYQNVGIIAKGRSAEKWVQKVPKLDSGYKKIHKIPAENAIP
jgi:uncharacterized protein (DUF169 family)